jgi:outer membrane receptor protein involved in Fe transport
MSLRIIVQACQICNIWKIMQTLKRNKKIAYLLTPIALATAQLIMSQAYANDVVGTLPAVEVVGVSPVTSFNVPLAQYPGNIQVLRENDIESQKSSSFSELLGRSAVSVNLNEIQGNPFQLDLNYRGQRLSPVLGSAQGISAYLDGVRINEAFGDVISWDMLPESAISTITMIPGSNPMYGMNTLSGALVMTTKNGLTHEGNEVELTAGSFGRQRADVGVGRNLGNGYHAYAAATTFKEDGWREKSDSKLTNAFIKFGRDTEKTSWNVSVMGGTSDLKGNGLAPHDMYTTNYRQGYSFYDITENKSQQISFAGIHKLSNEEKLSLTTWYRHAKRKGNNGDVNEDYREYLECYDELGGTFSYSGCATDFSNQAQNGWNAPEDALINKNNSKQETYGATFQWDKQFGAHKLLSGVTIQQSKTRYQQWSADAEFDDARVAIIEGDFENQADHKGKNNQYALFVGDVFTPAPGTLLMGALRYDYAKVKNDLVSWDDDGPHPTKESFTYKKLNPSFGFSQVLNKQATVFGNWSQGMRVPTAFELGCSNPEYPCRVPTGLQDDPYLKPIISQTAEIGFRLFPTEKTRVTIAAFSNINKDDVMFVRAPSGTMNEGIFQNIGNTQRDGIELTARHRESRWELGASYTYLKARYKSSLTLPSLEEDLAVTSGTRIAGLPEHFFKFAAMYRLTPQVRIGGDVQVYGSQVVAGNETKNSPAVQAGGDAEDASGVDKLAGYGILNLNANYEYARGFNFFLRVNNVFDKKYASYATLGYNMFPGTQLVQPGGEAEGAVFYAPGAPRAVFAGVRYEFK